MALHASEYRLGDTVQFKAEVGIRAKCKSCEGKGNIPTFVIGRKQRCVDCNGEGKYFTGKTRYVKKVGVISVINIEISANKSAVFYTITAKNPNYSSEGVYEKYVIGKVTTSKEKNNATTTHV